MGEKRREAGHSAGVGISQLATASLVRPSTTSRSYRLRNSEAVLAIICLGPAVLVLAVVLAYPVVYELGLAFFTKSVLHPEQAVTFAGLKNFTWLFIGNDRFRIAVLHSVLLTFGDVSLELILGMIAALMLVNPFKGVSIVRSLAILPWAIPPVVVAFVFRAMLSPEFGLVNQIIRAVLTLAQGQPAHFSYDWLSEPTTAFIATTLVFVWKGFPFVFLVLLAGMQALPTEMSDAAKVDGATAWQEFWSITLPLLKPVIVIAAILRSISTFNQFDLVWLLTGGGPLNGTFVLPILVYNEAFVVYSAGRAAAVTAFMFIVLAVLTYLFLSFDREEVQQA